MRLFDPKDTTNIRKNADSELLDLLVEGREEGLAEILKAGIKMAQEGKKTEAKRLLLYVTDVQPNNEVAWLWLASVSEYPEELLCFLKNVLRINPSNQRALEWQKATRALMSKTFVQRGISAHKENCQELARQFFEEAIENDEENEVAWLWLASVEEDIQKKISYLEKVLQLNPENETAKSSLNAIRKQKAKELLKQANIAVVAGKNDEAYEKLEELMQLDPDIEEAWLLKAYLATSFEEKLFCFEKVLSIDPNNEMAKAGVEALREIKETPTETKVVESAPTEQKTEQTEVDSKSAESSTAEEAVAVEDKQTIAAESKIEESTVSVQTELQSEISGQKGEVIKEKADAVLQQNEVSEKQLVEESKKVFPEIKAEFAQEAQFETETIAEELLQEKILKEDSVKEGFEEQKPSELADELKLSDESEFAYEKQRESFELLSTETAQEETITEQAAKVAQEIKEQETPVETEVEEEREITEEAETVEAEREVFEKEEVEEVEEARFEEVEEVREEEIQVAESKEEQVTEAEEAAVSPVIQEEAVSTETVETEEIIEDLQEIQEKSETEQGKVIEEVSSAQESAKLAVETVRVPLILVVDDSPTVRKLIATKLEKSGYRVAQAVDGLDALEKINQEIPDLVLLDITMPNLDGYEVCKMIRSNEATKHIPVVMISGKDGFFDKVRGRMVGSTGYITKPFGPETLMSTVATYVKSSQKTN